jgi:hypothetical protein
MAQPFLHGANTPQYICTVAADYSGNPNETGTKNLRSGRAYEHIHEDCDMRRTLKKCRSA